MNYPFNCFTIGQDPSQRQADIQSLDPATAQLLTSRGCTLETVWDKYSKDVHTWEAQWWADHPNASPWAYRSLSFLEYVNVSLPVLCQPTQLTAAAVRASEVPTRRPKGAAKNFGVGRKIKAKGINMHNGLLSYRGIGQSNGSGSVPTHADLLRMLPGEQRVMLAQFNISLEEAWGRWQSAAPDMQFKNFVTREYWGMVEESGGVPGMEDEDTGGAPDIGGEDTGEGEIGDEELWGPQPRTAAGGGIPWLLVGAAAFFLWPMLKGKRRK